MWQSAADMAAAAEHPRYATVMGELAASFADAPESQTWELSAAFFGQGGVAPEVEPSMPVESAAAAEDRNTPRS